jgi:hypothetical protein
LQYKHHQGTAENLRDKRRCEQRELRKEKREQVQTGKRVRVGDDDDGDYEITISDVITATQKLLNKSDDRVVHLKLLRQAFAQGTALIDAFISVDNSVSCLIGLLTGLDANIQLEAAWCLTNMAAGTDEHAAIVIKHAGAYLVTYLSGSNTPLQDQCAWAIGNLAGDNTTCRETLIAQGALLPLIKLLKSPVQCVVQSSAFALSNLAREKPVQRLMVENGVLPSLAELLLFSPEKLNVITEAAWVMTYLAASGDYANEIQMAGIPDLLTSLIIQLTSQKAADYFQTITPVVRCIGNIACGLTDQQASATAFCHSIPLLQTFLQLLGSEHIHLRKETLWVLSNITALKSACPMVVEVGLLSRIVVLLSDIFDIRTEAVLCLCNLASNGADLCSALFHEGAVVAVIPLLKLTDPEVVHMALCLVEMILKNSPEAVHQFEENRGLDALEMHEYSSNDILRRTTSNILETYFYKDD